LAFANRSRGRFHQSRRRTTLWGQGPIDTGQAFSSATPTAWDTGSTVIEPVTIVRLRGQFNFYLESASAISSGFSIAVGIGITSSDAFTAGALPEPGALDDLSWPWLWHQFLDVRAITATIADGANAGAIYARVEIDGKAMRKQNPQETLFGVTQTIAESGTATARMFARVRVLDKLA